MLLISENIPIAGIINIYRDNGDERKLRIKMNLSRTTDSQYFWCDCKLDCF